MVGEQGGVKIPGFHFGNSPEKIYQEDLTDKTLILRSSSGTQGVVRANRAECILLGSLVVARATARYLVKTNPSEITLLAMGSLNGPDKEEDLACQAYMADILNNGFGDATEAVRRVKESESGKMCVDPQIDFKSPEDLRLATSVDLFDFAMVVQKRDNVLVASKVLVN